MAENVYEEFEAVVDINGRHTWVCLTTDPNAQTVPDCQGEHPWILIVSANEFQRITALTETDKKKELSALLQRQLKRA